MTEKVKNLLSTASFLDQNIYRSNLNEKFLLSTKNFSFEIDPEEVAKDEKSAGLLTFYLFLQMKVNREEVATKYWDSLQITYTNSLYCVGNLDDSTYTSINKVLAIALLEFYVCKLTNR